MKIFVIGLPKSGRTTVSKAIAEGHGYHYIDAMSWVKSTFRDQKPEEHSHHFEDEYQQYLSVRTVVNPWFVSDYIQEMVKIGLNQGKTVSVIDGISSPRDFTCMFDFKQDIIIFLNRTDNENDYRDHENIGTSVVRDYCFWMSSAGLITKNRWMECNFKIHGEESDYVKIMGAQNSVFIVRSISRAISFLKEKVKEIVES